MTSQGTLHILKFLVIDQSSCGDPVTIGKLGLRFQMTFDNAQAAELPLVYHGNFSTCGGNHVDAALRGPRGNGDADGLGGGLLCKLSTRLM